MSVSALPRRFVCTMGAMAALVLLCGCPAADRTANDSAPAKTPLAKTQPQESRATPASERPSKPALQPQAKSDKGLPGANNNELPPADQAESDKADEPSAAKPVDLGPPLVDDVQKLIRLDPDRPTWLDPVHKWVVLVGQVSRPDYLLEFFATLGDRGYESVVVLDVKPSLVHATLVALGAEPGHPVQFTPEFVPASGTEIEIEVVWKDKDGTRRTARAQDWIRNVQTKKALDSNWVFAGSDFYKDEATGKEYYQADGGDFIAVLNLPSAMLDLPIRSVSGLESRQFEVFSERVPPRGTPVTIVLKPKLDKGKTPPQPAR